MTSALMSQVQNMPTAPARTAGASLELDPVVFRANFKPHPLPRAS